MSLSSIPERHSLQKGQSKNTKEAEMLVLHYAVKMGV